MDRRLSLLGLAYRAGKILLGESALEKMKEVQLLFLASDASEKTKLRYKRKCEYYHIDVIEDYDGSVLSKALGRQNIKVIGITDEGFRESFLKE